MPTLYSDKEIAALIAEVKPLPANWRTLVKPKAKRGHREAELTVVGEGGSQFRLFLRQADRNPLDFSVILGVVVPKTHRVFRLFRCNGKSHEHTNRIENETVYDFHVHRATERYQKEGYPEDGYAEVTDKYSNFEGAIDMMIDEGGFVAPPAAQMDLFSSGGGNP